MNLQVAPHIGTVGATVSNIDLSQPLDSETVAELRQAWLDHVILVFHNQQLRSVYGGGGVGDIPELLRS